MFSGSCRSRETPNNKNSMIKLTRVMYGEEKKRKSTYSSIFYGCNLIYSLCRGGPQATIFISIYCSQSDNPSSVRFEVSLFNFKHI